MKKKELVWIGSSRKDLLSFPDEVKSVMGYGLYLAQVGNRHKSTTVLKGFEGSGVIEIIDEDRSGTYRVVYAIKFRSLLFVLHAFQKKSKQGIKTPKQDIDLINSRMKQAYEIYKKYIKEVEDHEKK